MSPDNGDISDVKKSVSRDWDKLHRRAGYLVKTLILFSLPGVEERLFKSYRALLFEKLTFLRVDVLSLPKG
jgi:hypothetical protein